MKQRTAIRTVQLFLSLFCAGSAYGQAILEGKVALPKPEPLSAPPPRYAGQVGQMLPPDPPRAVVFLEGRFPEMATNSLALTNQVLQLGMQFHPALLPIFAGTSVSFPNGDDFYHNVFSYSKPKRFDLGRYRKSDRPAPLVVFDQPGTVKLYCEIHQHMRGVILVLDTPYFTTSQTDGTYLLTNLPAGNFLVKAWIDEKHVLEKRVSLESGQRQRVDFDSK